MKIENTHRSYCDITPWNRPSLKKLSIILHIYIPFIYSSFICKHFLFHCWPFKRLFAVCFLISYSQNLYTFNKFKVEVTPWISAKHNMGMAINRTTWHEIKSCAKYFCSYDDYNWDWSLQHTSHQCLKKKLFAMVVRGPRVFHIGEWWELIRPSIIRVTLSSFPFVL